MTIFIANANGDWWEYQPGQALHILNTEDLDPADLEDIENSWGKLDGSEDYPEKLERVIWNHGHTVFFEEDELTRWTTK